MFRKTRSPHILTGVRGERAAVIYLLIRGYRILECNFRCPLGEIDIIARKRGIIVFVEVRTRRAGILVDPVDSIDDLKLAHFMDAARYYLVARKIPGIVCRFDIISVRPGRPFKGRILHYTDAFWTTDERPERGVRLKMWIRRRPRFSRK